MVLIVPPVINSSATTALMYITGGDNTDPPPSNPNDEETLLIGTVATASQTIGAVLHQVPNQPCVFSADPIKQSRKEVGVVIGRNW